MKVLFILSRFPYPLEKGDKLRAFQQIMNMHASGIEVHIAAISDCPVNKSHIEKIEPYCKGIRLIQMNKMQIFMNLLFSFFRSLPLQVGYFYSSRNKSFFLKAINEVQPDLIYCQLIRTALFVKDLNSFPKVIDYQDAFVKGTRQRLADAPVLLKSLFRREIRLVESFEKKTFNWFHKHFIISEQDKEHLSFMEKDRVVVLPNGIDTVNFMTVSIHKEYDVTFVGNMNYPPNVDASVFLVSEVMPLVWKVRPETNVQLAGANPAAAVRRMESDKVKVTGWVDDIRMCYGKSKVFIAPMRIGTGLQNKLLEAMSMKIPSITTSLSAEPLGAVPGKEILVGNSKDELAAHIIKLLSDVDFANRMAEQAHLFVTGNFSMEYSRLLLTSQLEETLREFGQKKR
jgi:glycosyltransferase involved in cell wall biosynthesis